MFFAKNKIEFISRDKVIYKKGIGIDFKYAFVIGILIYAIKISLMGAKKGLSNFEILAAIFCVELISLFLYNYYKTKEENKEIDYLISKVLEKYKNI
ncbi:MAG: hypothetical protein K6E51_08620 [Treponema sp.]|nr:hypothetical protein [Treponema sp.]